ncbi:hypothetical protein ACHAQJ_009889 [Trichoderma viride]
MAGDINYRDAVDEMRLCFDIPGDRDEDSWDSRSFGFAGFVNLPPSEASASPAAFPDLDQPITLPPPAPSTDPEEHLIVRFHLIRHRSCDLSSSALLASHLRAGCARHIPLPIRRRDSRYLPPKEPSHDARFTRLPLRRRTMARRGSQSPSKHSASGSTSPTTSQLPVNEEEDFANIVAPPDIDIAADDARQTIAGFRSSCLVGARQCAVSGKGRSWCISPTVGPALQACHIVPQQHYHLYPDPNDGNNAIEFSPRRLQRAWERTWSARNGILLLSHLHELFDSRLFSIHPDTLQVRAFVPYDVICDYHGRTARLPSNVDRNALRYHYDMCCIENMAAAMPLIDQAFGTEPATSGTTSPFSTRAQTGRH